MAALSGAGREKTMIGTGYFTQLIRKDILHFRTALTTNQTYREINHEK
jgi:hypothetical protein